MKTNDPKDPKRAPRMQSRTQFPTYALLPVLLAIDRARPRSINNLSAQAGDCLGIAQTAQSLLPIAIADRRSPIADRHRRSPSPSPSPMVCASRAPAIRSSLARLSLGHMAKRKSCAARACWPRAGWSRGVGGRWALVSAYDGSTNNFCISSGYRRCKQFLHPPQ